MLKHYRKEGCLFECRIRFAADKAGCIPWDYPLPQNISDIPLCKSSVDDQTLEQFGQYMDSEKSLANCNCLSNCQEVKYETQVSYSFNIFPVLRIYFFIALLQVSYQNLDIEDLCAETNIGSVKFAMEEWEMTNSPSIYWYKKLYKLDKEERLEDFNMDFMAKFMDTADDLGVPLVHGLPLNEAMRVCKEVYAKNIAKVTIEISEEQVMMTMKDLGVTFAEQLAIISMSSDFEFVNKIIL